eukprot:GHRR01006846.1.p1 GENE.GHRR01006846.1~~GHRR01006846.1.p1  ORF type:complete len:188 (-),score=26.02 GHRR01006846.1:823-1386(-)
MGHTGSGSLQPPKATRCGMNQYLRSRSGLKPAHPPMACEHSRGYICSACACSPSMPTMHLGINYACNSTPLLEHGSCSQNYLQCPNKYILDDMSETSQSKPSSKPWPVCALQAITHTWRLTMLLSSNTCSISCKGRAAEMSCLFASINSVAPKSRSSCSNACNSFLVSSSLARSAESTTHIKPSVFS